MKIEKELMRGAGPLAVMKQLSRGEMYGYELVKALSRQSGGVLDMGQSTLYPMLYNMEAKGLVNSRAEDGPNGKPRKYYFLTSAGKKHLVAEEGRWKTLVKAMGALGLGGAPVKGVAP